MKKITLMCLCFLFQLLAGNILLSYEKTLTDEQIDEIRILSDGKEYEKLVEKYGYLLDLTDEQIQDIKVYIRDEKYDELLKKYSYLIEKIRKDEDILKLIREIDKRDKAKKKVPASADRRGHLYAMPISTETVGKMSMGFGMYSLASFKYNLTQRLSAEITGLYTTKIKGYGCRFDYFLMEGICIGLEADFVDVSNELMTGKGYLILPFIGAEYFNDKKRSVFLTFGPGFVTVTEYTSGTDWPKDLMWIMNFGIYLYF